MTDLVGKHLEMSIQIAFLGIWFEVGGYGRDRLQVTLSKEKMKTNGKLCSSTTRR